MSALVLLNAIANFETATRPSVFWYLMVLFIVPLAAMAVVWGLGLGLSRRKSFDDNDRAAGLTAGVENRQVVTARRAADAPALEGTGEGAHVAPRH